MPTMIDTVKRKASKKKESANNKKQTNNKVPVASKEQKKSPQKQKKSPWKPHFKKQNGDKEHGGGERRQRGSRHQN